MNGQRYVLMDRDGVIGRRIAGGLVASWNQFEFLPGALAGLRFLAEHNFRVLVVSNQPGVDMGLLSAAELRALTQRMLLEVALAGGSIEQVYYCAHIAAAIRRLPSLLRASRKKHRPSFSDARQPLPCAYVDAQLRVGFQSEW
jgi:histidinol phosphatase-like enzyme